MVKCTTCVAFSETFTYSIGIFYDYDLIVIIMIINYTDFIPENKLANL